MRPTGLLHDCIQRIRQVLPDQYRPEQHALAALLSGVVNRQSCVLSLAGPGSPGPATDRSKQRRAQRLLANPRLHVPRAQRRLAQQVLPRCQGTVQLLLDGTVQGASAHQAGTVTLCLAVVWGSRALPLAWQTWAAGTPGAGGLQHLEALLAVVTPALRPGVPVELLADRGLAGPRLARAAQARGWHYILRLTRTLRVQRADGQGQRLAEALHQSQPRALRWTGVRLWPPRRKGRPGAGGWQTCWEQALVGNLVGTRHGASLDPWIVATDLPATLARLRSYRGRMRIEELFRDLKSFGWHWQQSRVRQPDRVERLLLVLALATLWMLELGEQVVTQGWTRLVEDASRRCYSPFQLGLRFVQRCLLTGRPLPRRRAHHPVPLAP